MSPELFQKRLIVHGLSRSGTTMLERLIDGQDGVVCFPHLFSDDPLQRALNGTRDVSRAEFLEFKRDMMRRYSYFLSIVSGHNTYLAGNVVIGPKTLISGIELGRLSEGMEVLAECQDMKALRDVEARLAKLFAAKVFAEHWTKFHGLAPVYLERPNSYWIELVRHPYDRIMSDRLAAPGKKLIEVLEESHRHYQFAASYKHPRYIVVRYEDLCDRLDQELARLSTWFGQEIKDCELLNFYGQPFYPNTSKSVLEGKGYFHQDERRGSRIRPQADSGWREKISFEMAAMIQLRVDASPFYELKPVTGLPRIKASLKLWRLGLREALRAKVLWALSRMGLSIGRPA